MARVQARVQVTLAHSLGRVFGVGLRLTLPSRGTSKSYRSWPPLMSNVRPHVGVAMLVSLHSLRCAPLSLRSAPSCSLPLSALRFFVCRHSVWAAPRRRLATVHAQSESARLSSASRASKMALSQSVVGAPRRSAAPGIQSVGAAEYGSSQHVFHCYPVVMASRFIAVTFAHKVARRCVRPNHSIERTC